MLAVCKKGDKEFGVIWDTVAYICTDNGETIERL